MCSLTHCPACTVFAPTVMIFVQWMPCSITELSASRTWNTDEGMIYLQSELMEVLLLIFEDVTFLLSCFTPSLRFTLFSFNLQFSFTLTISLSSYLFIRFFLSLFPLFSSLSFWSSFLFRLTSLRCLTLDNTLITYVGLSSISGEFVSILIVLLPWLNGYFSLGFLNSDLIN